MIRHRLKGFLVAAAATFAVAGPAFAGDVSGVWQRSDGAARVRFAPCGEGYCGTIVWLKNPQGPGQVGQQVFFGMGQAGPNKWTGQAFNPEDGKTYDGSMTLSGRHLTTQGCALGGMICKSQSWSKAG
jgi:uncharacterized protein (DUF2147 family)